MIVIEGPDGSGKSTLAEYLSGALNIPIHHSGGPPKSPGEILERQRTMNERLHKGDILIYDRAPCISDPIYGPLIRGGTPFEDNLDLALEMRMALRVPVIYCRPPTWRILGTQSSRHEDEKAKPYKPQEHRDGVKKYAATLIQLYDIAIGDFPHWRFDWSSDTETPSGSELVHLIRLRLKTQELVA